MWEVLFSAIYHHMLLRTKDAETQVGQSKKTNGTTRLSEYIKYVGKTQMSDLQIICTHGEKCKQFPICMCQDECT